MNQNRDKKTTGMKIGIISDTHDLLRPEVVSALQGCGYILHAGEDRKSVV